MAKIEQSLVVPYTSAQMYELINDIESYPQFLPWCSSTKIHSRDTTSLIASLNLVKGPIQQTITTHNQMSPNKNIGMRYVAGPFKSCNGLWQFEDLNDGGCKVSFKLDYEFASKLVALMIEPVFAPIAQTLVDAFRQRAVKIYG